MSGDSDGEFSGDSDDWVRGGFKGHSGVLPRNKSTGIPIANPMGILMISSASISIGKAAGSLSMGIPMIYDEFGGILTISSVSGKRSWLLRDKSMAIPIVDRMDSHQLCGNFQRKSSLVLTNKSRGILMVNSAGILTISSVGIFTGKSGRVLTNKSMGTLMVSPMGILAIGSVMISMGKAAGFEGTNRWGFR